MRKLLQATAFGGAALGLGACPQPVADPPIVCDPLPPPLQCERPDTFGHHVSATSSWVAGDGGTPAVAADLRTSMASQGGIHMNAAPQLDGGTLIRSSDGGETLAFAFAPAAGATSVTATVSGTCEGTSGSARLTFDLTGSRDAGVAVPVTISAP